MSTSSDNSLLIVASLEATAPELALEMDARNTWLSNLQQSAARVALYRRYEAGEDRAAMTTQMRKMLRLEDVGTGMTEFNDNYCEVIVNKQTDRLAVTSITTDNDAGNAWISEVLERNNWESLQDGIYRSSATDADVIVMVDPVTLKWSVEPVYDGFDGFVAIYGSDFITPIRACKLWSEASTESVSGSTSDLIMKMVVYQPSSVQYFKGKPQSDEIQIDTQPAGVTAADLSGTESVQGAEETTRSRSWELRGLPMVRFVNSLNITTGEGRSAIHSAITLQDVLNRTIHSMVMASEFSAFTLLWSIGMEIDVQDITPGAVVNLVMRDANGTLITELTEEAAAFLAACKVGQFAATPMDQFLTQIKDIAREMSHNTSTPIYGITTEGQVSGEALKQLEVGLIGKVERVPLAVKYARHKSSWRY